MTKAFMPDNMITRAEVATSVNRMLDRHADIGFIDANLGLMRHFTDLEDTSMWYFYDMTEAINSHEHYFDKDDKEVWDSVTGESAR